VVSVQGGRARMRHAVGPLLSGGGGLGARMAPAHDDQCLPQVQDDAAHGT